MSTEVIVRGRFERPKCAIQNSSYTKGRLNEPYTTIPCNFCCTKPYMLPRDS